MDALLPVLRQFVRDLEGKVAILEKDNGQLKQMNKLFDEEISNQKQKNAFLQNDLKTTHEEHAEEKIQLEKDIDITLKQIEKKNIKDKECCAAKHEKEIEEEHKKINILEKERNKDKNELQDMQDRLEEEKLSNNLKEEARRFKEDVITDLEEQIRNYERKRVKANTELRTAKERIMLLEEETLVQEQNKVVLLSKKLLQEEENVRLETEKNVQAMKNIKTCNDNIHSLMNELTIQEQNNQTIMQQLEKDNENAIKTLKEQHSHDVQTLEDQMNAQRNENESKMNEICENLVTKLQTENDMIHDELLETLNIKEELQHKILESSDKCDILVNACKEIESTMQDLESEKEGMLHEHELDKENYTKQYNEKIKHYETIIENKTKDVQSMQNTFDEQMKQYAVEKKSFDDMIIDIIGTETQ